MTGDAEIENEAHHLVEKAYGTIESKLDKDEITQEDIEECQDALKKALDHPEADIWVTMMCEGEKNRLEHQRYPDGRYEYQSHRTNREVLESIVEPTTIGVTVS